MSTFRYLLLVCLLLTSRGFADIMNVSVSGSVSGGGISFGCTPVSSPSFSFNGMNSQLGLGTYTLDKSGGQICTSEFTAGIAQVSAGAQQTADVTASGLTLATAADADILGAAGTFSSANASNGLTLSFDLTHQSIMDLAGSLTFECASLFFNSQMCSESGSVDLTGPGFHFSQTTNGPFNIATTLDSGLYVLTESGGTSANTQALAEGSSSLSLSAEFTQIPEPGWLASFPLLLLIVLHGVCRRSDWRRTDW